VKLVDRWRERLARAGERHRWLAVSVQVQRRFGEERGANLAAAISMRAFLSLFPVLVLAIAFVGFIGGNPHRILFFWHSIGNRFLTRISNTFTNLNKESTAVRLVVNKWAVTGKITQNIRYFWEMPTKYEQLKQELIELKAEPEDKSGPYSRTNYIIPEKEKTIANWPQRIEEYKKHILEEVNENLEFAEWTPPEFTSSAIMDEMKRITDQMSAIAENWEKSYQGQLYIAVSGVWK